MDYERELQTRLTQLETAIRDYELQGGEQSFQLYQRYVESGYQALPFAGGWVDQPVWWTNDVMTLELIGEKHWIPGEIKRVLDAIKGVTKRG